MNSAQSLETIIRFYHESNFPYENNSSMYGKFSHTTMLYGEISHTTLLYDRPGFWPLGIYIYTYKIAIPVMLVYLVTLLVAWTAEMKVEKLAVIDMR